MREKKLAGISSGNFTMTCFCNSVWFLVLFSFLNSGVLIVPVTKMDSSHCGKVEMARLYILYKHK